MYTAKLTYPIYDNNSSEFLELIRTILETEFTKQINDFNKTFLPVSVKTDEYLVNPISDTEINPAFCTVIKANMQGTEQRFANQQNDLNHYVIGVYAEGLENLRKITDAIYIILNDMDVKNYIFLYQNASGENLISDSGQYFIKNLSHEYEVSKTINDKNIVYGHLILQAEISEVPKINTYTEIDSVDLTLEMGGNNIQINQLTEL